MLEAWCGEGVRLFSDGQLCQERPIEYILDMEQQWETVFFIHITGRGIGLPMANTEIKRWWKMTLFSCLHCRVFLFTLQKLPIPLSASNGPVSLSIRNNILHGKEFCDNSDRDRILMVFQALTATTVYRNAPTLENGFSGNHLTKINIFMVV